MPWEVLGLDGETATERDVKRAYARLLKIHRPASDPEGFRKVHEAYEEAKREIRWREEMAVYEQYEEAQEKGEDALASESGSTQETPGNSIDAEIAEDLGESSLATPDAGITLDYEAPDPFTGEALAEPELPELFEERRSVLLDTLDREDEAGMWGALLEFNHVCVSHPDCIGAWGQSFARDFDRHRLTIAHLIPTDDLLRELDFEKDDACQFTISGLQEMCEYKGLERLALGILKEPGRYRNEAAARVTARLGTLLAMARPKLIEGLANHAFENSPLDSRNWIMGEVEYAISRARLFGQHLDTKEKEFWSWRFNDPNRKWDWDTSEGVNMVAGIAKVARFQPEALEQIEEVLPEDVWKSVELSIERKRRENPEPKQSPKVSEGWGIGYWGWPIGLIAYFVIKIFFISPGCNRTPEVLDLSDRRQFTEEQRRGMLKVQEILREKEQREQEQEKRRAEHEEKIREIRDSIDGSRLSSEELRKRIRERAQRPRNPATSPPKIPEPSIPRPRSPTPSIPFPAPAFPR